MALLVALAVGFAYLDGRTRYAVIAGGVLVEVVEAWLMIAWSRRGRARVGIEALMEREGVAITDLRPGGQVLVDGERWTAVAEPGCPRGARVVVIGHRGLELRVRPVAD